MTRSKIKVVVDETVARRVARKAASDGLLFVAIEAENQLVDILSVPPERSGEAYKRPGGTVHIASAPGESPAPDTGELRQSVLSFLETGGGDLKAIVGTPLERAKFLEFGYEEDGRIVAPRPFVSRLSEAPRIFAMRRAFALGVKQGQGL